MQNCESPEQILNKIKRENKKRFMVANRCISNLHLYFIHLGEVSILQSRPYKLQSGLDFDICMRMAIRTLSH